MKIIDEEKTNNILKIIYCNVSVIEVTIFKQLSKTNDTSLLNTKSKYEKFKLFIKLFIKFKIIQNSNVSCCLQVRGECNIYTV
jgi:hypothetical protein